MSLQVFSDRSEVSRKARPDPGERTSLKPGIVQEITCGFPDGAKDQFRGRGGEGNRSMTGNLSVKVNQHGFDAVSQRVFLRRLNEFGIPKSAERRPQPAAFPECDSPFRLAVVKREAVDAAIAGQRSSSAALGLESGSCRWTSPSLTP